MVEHLGKAPSSATPHRATKQRLLDAAELLFASHGFEGTSMRAITQAADTSLSAANYHFGSKQALLEAALVRRIEPVNRRRVEAIDALEKSSEGVVSVEALLEAFLRPGFEVQRESPEEGRRLREVAARFSADPHEIVSKLKFELFAPVMRRYLDALERALPDRTREDLALDFQFFLGVMIHVMSGKNVFSRDHADPMPYADETILDRMVSFATAGLRAGGVPRAPESTPGAGS
ncbi:MAG: TetR family transcriptional regulator [Deltaproteobacteria bacterium]|nr:TetR family transcriptional regulator [Deltaproteobacteria bacterium]MBW2665659.1 TetR family transcriptional regulator [Deltaproteobacteria bacterium]